jgi:hypothetical protein
VHSREVALNQLGLGLTGMVAPRKRVRETQAILEARWIAREQRSKLTRRLVIAARLEKNRC